MGKTLQEKKQDLRKTVKEEVALLGTEYCSEADARICSEAIGLEEFRQAETVFCYVGTAGEIDTRPILEAVLKSGKRLGVPKCVFKGVMEVYQIESPEDLESGSYGIPEPREGCRLIAPGEIDLAFVPCLCCSRKGERLGYGGGFYDRYLAKSDFTKIVLCREKLIREEIPTEPHDTLLDGVLSENGLTAAGRIR